MTMPTNQPPRTLLAVLAHPDDESFGMGGTLARYALEGVRVYLICATRGEAGTLDPDCLDGYQSVAERREAELECAANQLGLSGVYYLGYRDSGMPGAETNQHPEALVKAPLSEVSAQIATRMRELQPQVVLTFDPIGGYKHPDHIAIHRATVEAFNLASDPAFTSEFPPYQPAKLYFHLIPKTYIKLTARLLPLIGRDPRKLGRNQDIDLLSLLEDDHFPTHARIEHRNVLERADAAVQCHASQLGGRAFGSRLLHWARYLLGSRDYFMRAFPAAEPGLQETDLFAGI